uniref:uncharacterized protein LOC122606548 n=1 Tax=Erigeron canadensis TaxID=72917 RepID=UPI001CB97A2C|nr:uncharacterized protein LOC122606548 [Erigeron canadensis]
MACGGNNGGKRRRVTGSRELSSAREIEVPLNSPSTNESHNEVPLTNDAGGSDLSQQTPTLSAHRPYIFPCKNKFTDPKVGKVIIFYFKSMFSGPWPRWTDDPKGHHKLVFESFQIVT